ncbi:MULTISPECIES: class A beta-lactamase [Streptomyces]|uniref:Beta-lactamase n=1 Tax=Streptomyces solicathayae TaxID=3081768 RepID=A0ABZ0LMD6_9ACTN|nr:class A beta-lactamase [Streptomyces sp. HUAS YS2]WOX20651.1 class A beta-lactamase [Streptomyces sp. HUAS YS2]
MNLTHLRTEAGPRMGALLLALLLGGTAACAAPAPAPDPASDRPAVTSAAPVAADATPALTATLRKLERERAVRIGAVAYDTGTGRTVAHRADESFPILSVFKAFACAAVLQKARRTDPGLMERTVHWTAADEVPNSPVTEGRGAAGMTMAELCHATVTRSDNTAGNLVLKELGGPAGLTRFFRSLGDPVTRLDRWEPELNDWRPGERRDTTTPAALRRSFVPLVAGPDDGGALVPADRDRLNAWLRATETGDKRIRAGLPDGWTVGDKTGTTSSYGGAHDIAIAVPPSGAPVILVVLTRRTAATAAPDDAAVAATAGALVRELRQPGPRA